MKRLTDEQQHLLAHHIASEVKTSLINAAEKRYMNEVHSYRQVQSAIENSVKLIFSNLFEED